MIFSIRLAIHNFRELFRPMTLTEVMEHDYELAHKEDSQASHTIKTQQYIQHMARYRMSAIEDFKKGKLSE